MSSVYHTNGSIAVLTLTTPAGPCITFFDEGSTHGTCGAVLASFGADGTGSALFRDGRVRVVVTPSGFRVCNVDGSVACEGLWERHGQPLTLSRPLSIHLSPSFVLRILNRSDISVFFRGTVFNVGCRFVKGLARRGGGAGKWTAAGSASASPRRLQLHAARDVLSIVHENGWSLPRPSASGRETRAVAAAVRPALSPVVRAAESVVESAMSDKMRCSITRVLHVTSETVGKAGAAIFSSGDGDGVQRSQSPELALPRRPRVKSAKSALAATRRVRRGPPPPLPVPRVPASRVEGIVRGLPAGTVLLACVSLPALPTCRDVERVMAALNDEWRHSAKGATAEGSEAAVGEAAAAATVGGLDEDLGIPFRLVVCDCSRLTTLNEKYGFQRLPVLLGWYSGSLVYASTVGHLTLDGLRAVLSRCMTDGRAGRFLPEGFRFGSARHSTLADLAGWSWRRRRDRASK